MRILFVTQIVPYPPHGGVLQRGFNLLRELGRKHEVTLLAFHHPDELPEGDATERSRIELARFCARVEYFPLWPKRSTVHKIAAFSAGALYPLPFSVLAHRSSALAARIAGICVNDAPDLVHLDTIALVPYARHCANVPTVLAHHNIESQLMARRADYETNFLARMYVQAQTRRLVAYEQLHAGQFPLNITVSEADAETLRRISPGVRTAVIPNGVDTDYFAPRIGEETPALVYTGGMNMFANRDAVEWFIDTVLPLVKAEVPDVRFFAIGQRPSPRILAAAARDPAIEAPGFVDDVRPWVARAAVYVVPLRVGGGTRLKVVDAMAQGKAIVSTRLGAEGIDVDDGQHLLLADRPESFAASVVSLLRDQVLARRLGAAARERAEQRYAWSILGEQLAGHYSQVIGESKAMNPWLKRLYDLTPAFVQNALVSAFSARLERQRYGGRFPEFRALLADSQWWDARRMGEWQDERLRSIVRYANEHVPYYRELFRHHGIRAEAFRGRGDLHRIPVLTRNTVKSRIEDLKSRRTQDITPGHGHTSGTTGSPLSVYYSADAIAMNYAVMDRQYLWADARLARDGDRAAVVRGNVIVPLTQKRPPFWRHNASLNQLLMSSFHLTPDNLTHYYKALREFQPRVIDGYPSSLYVLAKVLINRGERLPLKAAITSSETLYDFQREAIETAFECRVFDYYAAAERVVFATECSHHQGHHLCEEYGVTEIVDEAHQPLSPGNEGFMVGTSLHNIGMPMIRYLTTDRTALKAHSCACGRPLPLMEDVTTKAEDLLRLRDGRLIPPSVLTHPFKPLDCIEASQLVQTDLDRLLIRLIPRPDYSAKHAEHLVRELKARLGQDMRIDIELVESMPRTARGKFKWVISEVDLGL